MNVYSKILSRRVDESFTRIITGRVDENSVRIIREFRGHPQNPVLRI